MKVVLKLLGLGQRARNVVSGDEGVRAKLERHQARLVIVARDAAPATRRDFSSLSARYSVPCVEFGTKD
ncbi:MAG: ribosomal L7Ae/L30e/S12e/Gadd45 family protein, partial [Candidatus Desulforudis sp.]|nr:ribosomal L7Ae/L30e/S12e/Gadd45 family protein [Desulforudis sp.]